MRSNFCFFFCLSQEFFFYCTKRDMLAKKNIEEGDATISKISKATKMLLSEIFHSLNKTREIVAYL